MTFYRAPSPPRPSAAPTVQGAAGDIEDDSGDDDYEEQDLEAEEAARKRQRKRALGDGGGTGGRLCLRGVNGEFPEISTTF